MQVCAGSIVHQQKACTLTNSLLQQGMTHGFVVEFDSKEDRDYYVHRDQTHQEFRKHAKELVEKATVFDFTPLSF